MTEAEVRNWYDNNPKVDALFGNAGRVTLPLTTLYETIRDAGGIPRAGNLGDVIEETAYDESREEITLTKGNLGRLTYSNEGEFWGEARIRLAVKLKNRNPGQNIEVLLGQASDRLWENEPGYRLFLKQSQPDFYWRARLAEKETEVETEELRRNPGAPLDLEYIEVEAFDRLINSEESGLAKYLRSKIESKRENTDRVEKESLRTRLRLSPEPLIDILTRALEPTEGEETILEGDSLDLLNQGVEFEYLH